jgi:hypothetical protein
MLRTKPPPSRDDPLVHKDSQGGVPCRSWHSRERRSRDPKDVGRQVNPIFFENEDSFPAETSHKKTIFQKDISAGRTAQLSTDGHLIIPSENENRRIGSFYLTKKRGQCIFTGRK